MEATAFIHVPATYPLGKITDKRTSKRASRRARKMATHRISAHLDDHLGSKSVKTARILRKELKRRYCEMPRADALSRWLSA